MKTIPNNARVCFVGDSITANNGYISYIQSFYHENCKDCGIKFYTCGVSGGSTATQLTYFDDDTARHNPTHVFIMLGVNDSWRDRLAEPKSKARYDLLVERYEIFKDNLEKLYQKAKSIGAEVIFMTPPPYAEYMESETPAFPGAYALIQGYADHVKSFALSKGCDLVDVHGYLTAKMQEENLYNPDRVHPNEKGHYHIASCILNALGFENAEYAPIPSYMDEIRSKVQALRYIYFAELVIIGNYALPLEEKRKKIEAYLATPSPAFEIQAKGFLEHVDNKEQLYKDVEEILCKGFEK